MSPAKRKRSPPAAHTEEEDEVDDGEVSFNLPPSAKRPRISIQEDDGASSPPQPRRSPNGFLLPDPIPAGFRLSDNAGGSWVVGGAIGLGGFGEIYAARRGGDGQEREEFVVKVEPHTNGPLFVEIAFYLNAAREEQLAEWRRSRGLDHVGVAGFVASGSLTINGKKFRFLVLPRLGADLQSVMDASAARAFSVKTACSLATQVIDSLEYIHSHGYIHKDVKGSNILFARRGRKGGGGPADRITLVDFGLCSKFCPGGLHKPYSPDRRWAHEGTLEYTSRDCHLGCFSRRGDVEVTMYNLVEWLGGKLPWEDWQDVKPSVIQEAKVAAYADIPAFLELCFLGRGAGEKTRKKRQRSSPPPAFLRELMERVAGMRFDEEPDYEGLRQILQREMGRTSPRGKSRKPLTLSSEDEEVSFSLQLRSAQENEKENEDPVTVSDEGKERNPRKRRKKVRAVRRLKKGGQLAGGVVTSPRKQNGSSAEEDDGHRNCPYRHQLKLSAPTPNASGGGGDDHDHDDDGLFLDASEHAISAAEHRRARRESFRLRGEASMRNPTPAMLRQARAMAERAAEVAAAAAAAPSPGRRRRSGRGKSSRRATPQKWRNLTPTDLTPAMKEVIERRARKRREGGRGGGGGGPGDFDQAGAGDGSESEPSPSKVQSRRKFKFGSKKKPPSLLSSPSTKSAIAVGRKRQLQQLQQLRQMRHKKRSQVLRQQLHRSRSVPVALNAVDSASSSLSYIVDAGMGLIRGISRNLFNGFVVPGGGGRKSSG